MVHGPTRAALGEAPTADRQPIKTSRHVADEWQYVLREIQLESGTLVREYVSVKGTVFAVTWQGPFLPDLRQLLGRHFTAYTDAAQKAGGRGPLYIDSPELVVQSGGRMRAFSGRAYLPQEIPENFSLDHIQ
jgi:hypothetical protein